MEKFFVKLVREPSVQLCYSFLPSLNTSPRGSLIVFLNGINIPHTAWYAVATTLKKENPTCPPMLLYDRVGQAASIGHNLDVPGRPKGHGRDCLNAAHDLREVITHVGETRLGISRREIDNLDIILVASSVSCAIARLYATEYPRTVTVLLLLDSTLANSDTVSVFPDPESAEFSPVNLPPGVTRELCVDTRKKIFPIYGSESPNPEGLWRGNLPDLLPYAELPKLEGPKPGLPYVTVVAHDPEIFPSQVKKTVGLAEIMTRKYFDPAWQRYNEGLVKITSPKSSKGPVIAKGCGHLIQRDNPQLVVEEVLEILEKLIETRQAGFNDDEMEKNNQFGNLDTFVEDGMGSITVLTVLSGSK